LIKTNKGNKGNKGQRATEGKLNSHHELVKGSVNGHNLAEGI